MLNVTPRQFLDFCFYSFCAYAVGKVLWDTLSALVSFVKGVPVHLP